MVRPAAGASTWPSSQPSANSPSTTAAAIHHGRRRRRDRRRGSSSSGHSRRRARGRGDAAGCDGDTAGAALSTQGYIKYFRNAADYGLPSSGRTKFGYLCVEGMVLRMPAGEVDTAPGELPMREYTVLPTHYQCPHSGASMPVENPDVWVYHDELNDPDSPGETLALMEVFGLNNIRVKRFPYASRVSYFAIE